MCGWAFVAFAQNVGHVCFPGQDKAFQGEVDESVARIDAYVLKNGPDTPADIVAFKHDQAQVGRSAEELCTGDGLTMYNHFRGLAPGSVRAMTDSLVSRPGKPTWGDCM